jgi:hypothetical protein
MRISGAKNKRKPGHNILFATIFHGPALKATIFRPNYPLPETHGRFQASIQPFQSLGF